MSCRVFLAKGKEERKATRRNQPSFSLSLFRSPPLVQNVTHRNHRHTSQTHPGFPSPSLYRPVRSSSSRLSLLLRSQLLQFLSEQLPPEHVHGSVRSYLFGIRLGCFQDVLVCPVVVLVELLEGHGRVSFERRRRLKERSTGRPRSRGRGGGIKREEGY